MRPPLRNFGGHQYFRLYMHFFRSLYCDPENQIRDVKGRLVLFDQDPYLDDCVHVCYGSKNAGSAEFWNEEGAQRIAWIGEALSRPNAIHPDKDGPNREKYLLRLPPDDDNQDTEFYCVIVRLISKKVVAFLTAYRINQQTMDKYQRERPRIYPEPQKRRSK